jgi:hypothetical protein
MKWFSVALALVGPCEAALRFGCAALSVQRLDPIVEPGAVPSGHLHQIVGGNAFNATMDPSKINPGNTATCTTCTFSEDFSNYWTAVMFFKAKNGTFKRVPQYANADLTAGINGGMTVYYTQQDFSSNGNQKITAFKPGFRMTVGSPKLDQSAGEAAAHHGLRYTCLQTVMTRFPESQEFPKGKCPAGIMAVHHFPSCWNGKDLDSPDHQSHMYNNAKEAFAVGGACPSTHPIRMPQVAYETLWDTSKFNDLWDPSKDPNPFYWSTGDNKGYSTHADYLFGWKGDALQKAMDSSCMFQGCENGKPLKSQSAADMNKCNVKSSVHEEFDGWVTAMPGKGGAV